MVKDNSLSLCFCNEVTNKPHEKQQEMEQGQGAATAMTSHAENENGKYILQILQKLV